MSGQVKTCVLDESRACVSCGECDKCDLDPGKACDNCMKCVVGDEKFRTLAIDEVALPGEGDE